MAAQAQDKLWSGAVEAAESQGRQSDIRTFGEPLAQYKLRGFPTGRSTREPLAEAQVRVRNGSAAQDVAGQMGIGQAHLSGLEVEDRHHKGLANAEGHVPDLVVIAGEGRGQGQPGDAFWVLGRSVLEVADTPTQDWAERIDTTQDGEGLVEGPWIRDRPSGAEGCCPDQQSVVLEILSCKDLNELEAGPSNLAERKGLGMPAERDRGKAGPDEVWRSHRGHGCRSRDGLVGGGHRAESRAHLRQAMWPTYACRASLPHQRKGNCRMRPDDCL